MPASILDRYLSWMSPAVHLRSSALRVRPLRVPSALRWLPLMAHTDKSLQGGGVCVKKYMMSMMQTNINTITRNPVVYTIDDLGS